MRRASTLLAVLCAVAVAAVVVTGLLQRSSLAFTLGVAPSVPAAEPVNGRAVCQSPIAVPAAGAFDRIRLEVDPRGRPGPALEAQVRDRAAGGRVIARGTLAAGYGKGPQTITVDEVPAERTIDVCLINRSARPIYLIGNADAASRSTSSFVDGAPGGMDLTLVFERSPRSPISEAGAIAERVSLFKLGWIGSWTSWLLVALVLLAVPALLVRAVRELR